MKKSLKIYVYSPLGKCNQVKRIHLDIEKNDLEYSCPKCNEKYSYYEQWFGSEPNGKTIMCNPNRFPKVLHQCEKCEYEGELFTMTDIEEDHIIVKDGEFNLSVIKEEG